MDLNTLVQILRQQAGHDNDNKVTFNKDFLTDAQIDALRAGFALAADVFFTINGISPGAIPNPADGEVVLTAGTVDVLSQTTLSLRVVFTVDNTQTLQFTIAVNLPESWQFKNSFKTLTVFPFDQVDLSSNLATPTRPKSKNSYFPWPTMPTESVALVPGLNIATWLKLNIFYGALVLLEQVLNGTDKYKFYGPLVPSGTL